MASFVVKSEKLSSITIECDGCTRQLRSEDRFYQCRKCQNYDLCQACTLKNTNSASSSHDLRPCMIDPRDLRRTYITGPSVREFVELLRTADAVPSGRYSGSFKSFLIQGGTHDLEGVIAKNLATPENYEIPVSSESAITKAVQNDYSFYEDLNHENKDIRLISLVRGSFDAPIEALVGRFAFPWTQVPWRALSYCWGSLDETRTISLVHMKNRVNDGQTPQYRQQAFYCTANLDIALRSLRREDTDLWFWVDALCINQGDPKERASQVSMMSEIFAHANGVAIWLALSLEERLGAAVVRAISHAATEVGQKFNNVPIVHEILHRVSFTLNDVKFERGDIVQSIAKFFQNSYWKRVWVLQEVWSARADVVIWCGSAMTIPWEEVLFASIYLMVAYKDFKTTLTGLRSPWLELTDPTDSRYGSPRRIPILHLIKHVCHHFSASDPRDILFALLALGSDTHTLPPAIAPDYTKPTAQVYIDFTKWCILHHQSLEVLGYITSIEDSLVPVFGKYEAPSWTIFGSKSHIGPGTKYSQISAFRASGDISVGRDLVDASGNSHMLPLRGYQIDAVGHVNKVHFLIRFDKDNDLYLRDSTNAFYTGKGGGLNWVWLGAHGPDGREARFCTFVGDSNYCTCRGVLDQILLTLTCGGYCSHGDCDSHNGVHQDRWFKPEEMYEMFATHWVTRSDSEHGDPNFDLFCEHVREILLPLATKGDPDEFARMLLNASGRALFITGDRKPGLCPPDARKGDVIAALFGGKAPFVLRRRDMHDASSTAWELIGECFLLPHMYGETVEQLVKQGKPSEVFHLY